MKELIMFVIALNFSAAQAKTVDDFLSTTLLGQKIGVIEKSYQLDSGSLKDFPAYVEIGELGFGGLKFKLSIFCRDGECRAYGISAEQLRIKDKNGKLKHRDNAEIYDVFKVLLGKFTAYYGVAPRVKLESRCCGCGSGPLSQSYAWTNDEYALMFGFHDNITTQSITLTQYRRNEKNGEFTGTDEISFFENLYKNRSGKLPIDWPSSVIRPKTSQDNPIVADHSGRQPRNDESVDQKKLEVVKQPQENPTPSRLPWIIIGVLFVVIFGLLFKKWSVRKENS